MIDRSVGSRIPCLRLLFSILSSLCAANQRPLRKALVDDKLQNFNKSRSPPRRDRSRSSESMTAVVGFESSDLNGDYPFVQTLTDDQASHLS